jgi:hypothetical protein
VGQEMTVELQRGESLSIEKIAALYTSRDHAIADPRTEAPTSLARAGRFVRATVWRGRTCGASATPGRPDGSQPVPPRSCRTVPEGFYEVAHRRRPCQTRIPMRPRRNFQITPRSSTSAITIRLGSLLDDARRKGAQIECRAERLADWRAPPGKIPARPRSLAQARYARQSRGDLRADPTACPL